MNNNFSGEYKSIITAIVLRYNVGRKTIQWRKQYIKRLIINKLLSEKQPIAHQIESTSFAITAIIAISIIMYYFTAPQSLSIFVFLAGAISAGVYVAARVYLRSNYRKIAEQVEPVIDNEIEQNEGTP